MQLSIRLAAAAAFACALAGCAAAVDAGQARICRTVIPALNPSQAAIAIARSAPLAGGDGVRIEYRERFPGEEAQRRFVECRFIPSSHASAERGRLVGVRTETGALGELRLHILQRFWIESVGPEADPEPVANVAHVPAVPRALAVALQHGVLALPSVAIYSLLAVAYALVYGLVGRINLAFGELAAVGGYAAFLGFAIVGSGAGLAVPLLVAFLLALAVGLTHGLAIGRFVFAPLLCATGQQVLIGTLALAIVLQEYLRLAQGSQLKWVQPVLNTPLALARSGDFVVTVTPAALAAAGFGLLAALGLLCLMRVARFGRAWRACADDPVAAALCGIDRDRVMLKTVAVAAALAGLAGYVVTVYYGTLGYAGGTMLGLKSLVAAVAGGIGSVPGAFLGGILVASIETLWSALFPIAFRNLAIFVLLVLFLVFRPTGLLGVRDLVAPKV